MTLAFPPTPEQTAILSAYHACETSLLIRALAGCGKTSTIELIANATPRNIPGLALAFNVKIKAELERRFPPNFTVLTLNGLGHRAWARAIGKRLIVDDRKLGRLITTIAKEWDIALRRDEWANTRSLISLAQHRGLVPSVFPISGIVPDEEAIWNDLADELGADISSKFARAILIANIKEAYAGTVSFDDQVYMSALFQGAFPRFPLVLVDEAQDLSPLNHLQVKRCAAGRLVVVGDDKQAIYSFRGADSASINKLKALRPEWIELPLATTFRCPKSIVARQQMHAIGFTAFETNAEGEVQHWPIGESWSDRELIALHEKPAILCRNNAPLLELAFKLIKEGIGCYMLGRDIGKGLIALAKKIIPLGDTPANICETLITDWCNRETSLALANNDETKAEKVEDKAQCLLAVLHSSVANAAVLQQRLSDLFSKDSGSIVLSTGHRAKGLEWEVVMHLDPWRIPSKWAKSEAAQQQERNLRYVIETRAKRVLILASLEHYAAPTSMGGPPKEIG